MKEFRMAGIRASNGWLWVSLRQLDLDVRNGVQPSLDPSDSSPTKSLKKLHDDCAPVEFRESECIPFWEIGSFGTSRGSI